MSNNNIVDVDFEENKYYTFGEVWPVAAVVYFGSILLAYVCLKCYDEPVRRWLGKKLQRK